VRVILADKTCDTRSAYVAVAVCARVRACKIARPREAPAKSQSRAPRVYAASVWPRTFSRLGRQTIESEL